MYQCPSSLMLFFPFHFNWRAAEPWMLSETKISVAPALFDQCPVLEKLLAVFYDISCWTNQSVELWVRVSCWNCFGDGGGGVSRCGGHYCNRVSYHRHEKNRPHPSIESSVSLAIHPSIDSNIQPIRKHHHETYCMCCLCYLRSATTTIPTS